MTYQLKNVTTYTLKLSTTNRDLPLEKQKREENAKYKCPYL